MRTQGRKVVILGCGWLGQIVGEALVRKGYDVYGSYRRPEVEQKLDDLGIQGFELDFNADLNLPEKVITDADFVFAFITPSSAKSISYDALLENLFRQFPESARMIFSSSTGIYPKDAGEYDESYEFDPSLPNRLLPAETAIRKSFGNRLTILRLGGLIGPKRHPAYSLSGKEVLNNGMNPINLIHARDIVAAIEWFMDNGYFGRTYNLVYPHHPPKRDYYSEATKHFGVEPPKFGTEPAVNRLIEGNEIEQNTSFRYRHALDNFDDFLR
ncbi:MAG: NAD-dependent epimerase/dehydratase family protein [bacterium]|nr:NAD-dependent epimerase/dehydratase family protein [bacterium]